MITEHERRILNEIELRLRMDDPRFAARLTTVRAERLRLRLRAWRTLLSSAGAALGAAMIVAFFATAPAVALLGVAMLGTAAGANVTRAATALERTFRRLVKRLHRSAPPSAAQPS